MDKVLFAAFSEFNNILLSSDSELLDLINAGKCKKYHIHNLKLQNLSYLSGMMQAFTILGYGTALERSKFYSATYALYEHSMKTMFDVLSKNSGG